MKSKAIHLLLIEDDKVDQMAFERFVKRENLPYEHVIAGSVAEATTILKSTSFDVIISDYMLGDGTSFELFDLCKGTPVIITTGSGDEDIAVQAMKLGASDYLIKDPEGNYLTILPVTVNLALKRKQTEDELRNYHERLESMVEERTAQLQAEIVERKQAEEQNRELEAQLHQKYKMEAVGLIAGGMAHNFNNNLAIILGNVELAQLKMPANSDVINYLKNAKIAVLRSRDLIQQIMTFSRKEQKGIIPIQLALVVDETLKMLSPTIPSTVNLRQEISKHIRDIAIQADPSQIQEILLNLCTNAVHAMGEKGDLVVSLETAILQQQDIPAQYESQPGCYAKLSVEDNGSGMTEETQKKIFDPFFTTKEVGKGTGMGLSTVYGIVMQYKGIIKVKSIVGQGTTFELYFPVVESQQLEIPAIVPDLPRGNEKILFLDDDEMLTNVWSEMLTEYGYQVDTMTSSTETLKLFKANPDYFDLLITDQTMPDMTGQELIREILNIRPQLPTILCTGYSTKIDKGEAEEQGIKAFCEKPLDLAELLVTTRRVLDENR